MISKYTSDNDGDYLYQKYVCHLVTLNKSFLKILLFLFIFDEIRY